MKRPVLIIDTETTGLDPERHQVWELAVIERDINAEHVWRMKPDLARADPQALAVGRYYERAGCMGVSSSDDRVCDLTLLEDDDPAEWSDPESLAAVIAPLLAGATLVAANPAFDAGFLAAFLRAHGHAPAWHYRLRDIGSMAWAWLQPHYLPLDAGTDDLARSMGIDPDDFERHSALGDCLLVAAMLGKIEEGAR